MKYFCWEFIIEHVHSINFSTRDSLTYVIFGIDIKCGCMSSLSLNEDRLVDLLLVW
jgi:hypothetical protein